MISLSVSSIKSAVRTSLDELQTNASYMAGVQDADNEDLDTIIEGKIVEAVTAVHRLADRSLVAQDAPIASLAAADVSADGLVLKINVPTMLRFVALKATDSPFTVSYLLEEGTPGALRQNDNYASGTYERPEAVLHRGSSSNQIWYYKLATTPVAAQDSVPAETAASRVERLEYLPIPAISSNSIDVCAPLKDAVISMLTGMVLTVFKDSHADSFFSQAKLQMGLQ